MTDSRAQALAGLTRNALRTCRRAAAIAAAFSIAINLLMLTLPIYMLQLFDRVLLSRSAETLLMLTILALAALMSMAALDMLRGLLLARLGMWVEQKLGGYLLAGHIATAAQSGGHGVQSLRDLAVLRRFLGGAGITPLLDIPWTPIFLLAIFVLHPVLGGVALAGAVALLLMAVCAELAGRPLLRLTGKLAADQASAEHLVRNADAIEAMGMVPALLRRWQADQKTSMAVQKKAGEHAVAIAALSRFLRFALQVAVFGVGAYLAIGNEITAGALVAASILMGRALAPVEMAIGGWRSLLAATAAFRRIRAALASAPIARPAMTLPIPSGRLEVQQLTFGYRGAAKPVLRGIGFVVEPGAALGLLGPAATGKTTLARLLAGTLRPQLGQVRLDGVSISELSPQDRARSIGYLPQDVVLFRGSVRENIARFQEASDEEVVRAAQLAGVHAAILRLPDGYDTLIGEDGLVLSGGQRQLIALARAVFGNPKLVILDEPNSNLDAEGEAALGTAVRALGTAGTTLIVIAHRGPVLKQMNKLLLLKEGQIAAFGAPGQVVPDKAEAGKPQLGAGLGHG